MADCIQRFHLGDGIIRGQWVRLSTVLADAFRHQHYPPHLQHLLSEMLLSVACFAETLKYAGAVSIQAKSNGALTTAFAECREQSALRGILRFTDTMHTGWTLGDAAKADGRMAITFMPDDEYQQPYQGQISIVGEHFSDSLAHYFAVSEQVPTRLFIAHGTESGALESTALLLQRMPLTGADTEIRQDEADAIWIEAGLRLDTLTTAELARWDSTTLLGNLFAGMTVFQHTPRPLHWRCTCSRERADGTFSMLSRDELLQILEEDGEIAVTCEFCGTTYTYDHFATHALITPTGPSAGTTH